MDDANGDAELRTTLTRAADLAASVPEKFQVAAFSFVCSRLLESEHRTPSKRRSPRARTAGSARRPITVRSGLGPKAALMDAVDAGFLAEPRTIEAISAHIKEKRGHTFNSAKLGTALLRMLRAGEVSREKDEDGEYRYRNV